MESRSKEQMGFDIFKNQNGEKVYVGVLFCLLFLELVTISQLVDFNSGIQH